MLEIVLFPPLPVKMILSNKKILSPRNGFAGDIKHSTLTRSFKTDKGQADLGLTGSVTVVHGHKNGAKCCCRNMLGSTADFNVSSSKAFSNVLFWPSTPVLDSLLSLILADIKIGKRKLKVISCLRISMIIFFPKVLFILQLVSQV